MLFGGAEDESEQSVHNGDVAVLCTIQTNKHPAEIEGNIAIFLYPLFV